MAYDEAKKSLPKIGHGMEKKVMACIESLDMGVKEAIMTSGDVERIQSRLQYPIIIAR